MPQAPSVSGVFLHRMEMPRTICRCFRAPTRPWLPTGASGSCGVAATPPTPPAHPSPCRPGHPQYPWLSHPPPPPQIYKGAHAEERVQWCLPKGATFFWLPHPERTLEGMRSLALCPGLAQQHPHIPPGPAAPADLGS